MLSKQTSCGDTTRIKRRKGDASFVMKPAVHLLHGQHVTDLAVLVSFSSIKISSINHDGRSDSIQTSCKALEVPKVCLGWNISSQSIGVSCTRKLELEELYAISKGHMISLVFGTRANIIPQFQFMCETNFQMYEKVVRFMLYHARLAVQQNLVAIVTLRLSLTRLDPHLRHTQQ